MMFRRCYSMNMHNVHMPCHLFYSLVKPIMNCGCDIWSPHIMAKKKSFDGEAEVWHRSVLWPLVGIRKSVSTAIFMHEMVGNLYVLHG
jgi:hypothetical protein